MTCVTDVMQAMTVTASGDESVRSAATRMEALRMDCLPVIGAEGKLIGLLTCWEVRRAHPNRLVIDSMTKRLVYVPSTATIWEAYRLTEERETEYVVVLDRERPVGMVARTALEVAVALQTDALTGLPTAAYLQKHLEMLWHADQEIYLLFIDINQFGRVNKRLGHVVGDRILMGLTQILAARTDAEHDVLCRYGGDEFAIVTNRSRLDAQQLGRTLVSEVEQAGDSLGHTVSIAVGIAGGKRRPPRQQDPTPIASLINLASRASTEAKRANGGILVVDIAAGA